MIPNNVLVSRYLCAGCWGPLVEKYIGQPGAEYNPDNWVVVCARDARHVGKTTKFSVERRRYRSKLEAMEVRATYGAMLGLPKPDTKSCAASLYGDGSDIT